MPKKDTNNSLLNFFTNIIDACRAFGIAQLMSDYQYQRSGFDLRNYSPAHTLLAKLLGVEPQFFFYFDKVLSGDLSGIALCGADNHPATLLAQSMFVNKYGFKQHPHLNYPSPIHPKALEEIEQYIKHGHKESGFHSSCKVCQDNKE